MLNKIFRYNATLLVFLLSFFSFCESALAVPDPVVNVQNMPSEQFVGEQFCITATFTNNGTTGYGPYYQLFLKPDFALASAEIFGSAVATTLVGTFPGVTTDPISGEPVSGPAGSSFYTLEPPVGSVTNGGAPLNTNICIDLDGNATPDTIQNDAVQVTPGLAFGDSPTGSTPIIGTTVNNSLTPRIVTFIEQDLTDEDETPPGPAFTYNIEAVADIASDRAVSPVIFPRIELTDNRQFVGPIENIGGSSCTATVTNKDGVSQSGALPFTPTHMTDPGGYIDVTCSSGTGTIGNTRDVIITVPVYAIDNLDINECSYENNITRNISKHMVVRKSADITSVRPANTVTYTLSFAVSEFASAENVVITDVMPDGLTYVGVSSMTIEGSTVAISPSIANNVPSGGQTTVTYDVSSAYGSTLAATTTGVITYTATVDETYNNGDPIRSNDRLTNDALIEYSVVGGAGAAPNYCTDTSTATLRVIPLTISKTLLTSQTEFSPGEVIRFRLRLDIPSGDTQNISFSDFLPLPALTTGSLSTNTNLASNPNFSLGPNDTLGLTPTSITTNAVSNSFTIQWPDISSTTAEVIEIDLDAIAATTDPFADNLFLTNIFELKTTNTHGEDVSQYDAVSFKLRAPDVSIEKNVTPTSNVDAGDTVNYTIDLTNNGGRDAYDVIVRDVLPAGLSGCTISSQPAGSGDLFTTSGYALTNPIAPNGIASFAFSCVVDYSIQISGSHTNTAYVSFASAVGATPFPERSDTAVFSSSPSVPTKMIVSTSQTHTPEGTADTSAAPRPVSIGETVRYRLVTQIPEGTATGALLRDYLPSGQQYVTGSATVALVSNGGIANSFTCTTGSGLNVIGNSSAITPSCGIDANGSSFASGTDPVFNIGNLVNNDDDADDEFIVLEFDAIVLTSYIHNQQYHKTNNLFRASFSGTYFSYSNRVYIQVKEPQLTVSPTVLPTASNAVSISLGVSNTGQATAFQVQGEANTNWSFTLPNGLKNINNIALSLTGNVYENNTTTLLTSADFSVSGINNEIITLLKPIQMDPSDNFTLSFEADVIPGVTPSSSIGTSVFEYASQATGDESSEVRTGSDISAGTGNTPITSKTQTNDYRTETPVAALSISGTVYVDTNSDATLAAGESGISGVTIVLRDTSANTCRSVQTNADGKYSFFPVSSGNYQVIQSAQESTPIPSQCPPPALDPVGYASTSPNVLSITVANNSVPNQNFGELSGPALSPDHNGQVLPGNVAFYAHKFTTPADGTVVFSSSVGSTSALDWGHVVYRDSNCDGVLNGSEANTPISGINLGINSGGQLCIINKVYAPSNVPAQDQYKVIVNAQFTYDGGGLAPENLNVTDLTTSGANAAAAVDASRLVLRKTVENITQSTPETETQNQAKPGDTLKYRLYYRNTGTGSIDELVIDDTLPSYTGFVGGSEACDVTPPSMICMPTVNVNKLRWEFLGPLEGGDSGLVSYEVKVDD
ncbi:MAG: isopeptide-forming domain-containing fimbrial protein [Leucothrix sp.]